MAASGNLLIESNISLTEISMWAFDTLMPMMADRPIETATETVSAKHSTIVPIMIEVTGSPHGRHCVHDLPPRGRSRL